MRWPANLRSTGLVIGYERRELEFVPTGRPAKSRQAIVDKLRRESIRLTQIQDIAGCRIVVPNLKSQTLTVVRLTQLFPNAEFIDRREVPSHGYRAVHVVVPVEGHAVEVQVRTLEQHWWAELSEKLSDVFGVGIKYGAGDPVAREKLRITSAALETLEREGARDSDIAEANTQLGGVVIWAVQYVPLKLGL